jgi:hypothetical protein
MEAKRRHFSADTRRMARMLWKAKVPPKKDQRIALDVKKGSYQAVGAQNGCQPIPGGVNADEVAGW